MRRTYRILTAATMSALTACAGSGEPARSGTDTPTATWDNARQSMDNNATVRHMHLHAEQLDKLNAALDAGDLEGAATPAYWLSRHDQLEGVPVHWWSALDRMRAAAQVIEETNDLSVARDAAERLEQACNHCHRNNEVSIR